MSKTQETTWIWAKRLLWDQNSGTYLHLLCYFVYQNTSNNALPFQSWSSTCNSLSTHENKMKLCLLVFYFIIYLLACPRAKSKSAAVNEPIFAVNLCWLSHDLHKVTGLNGHCVHEMMLHAGQMPRRQKSQRPPLLEKKLLSFLVVSFNMCRQSKTLQNTFCFQSGSLTSSLKSKGSSMFSI